MARSKSFKKLAVLSIFLLACFSLFIFLNRSSALENESFLAKTKCDLALQSFEQILMQDPNIRDFYGGLSSWKSSHQKGEFRAEKTFFLKSDITSNTTSNAVNVHVENFSNEVANSNLTNKRAESFVSQKSVDGGVLITVGYKIK